MVVRSVSFSSQPPVGQARREFFPLCLSSGNSSQLLPSCPFHEISVDTASIHGPQRHTIAFYNRCNGRNKGPCLCRARQDNDEEDGMSKAADLEKSEQSFWASAIDNVVEEQRKRVQEAEEKVQELDRELEGMRREGVPGFLLKMQELSRNMMQSYADQAAKSLEEMQEKKYELEKELESHKVAFEDKWTAEDYAKFALTGEGAATTAVGLILGTLIQSLLTSWIASLNGIEVGTLLHDLSIPTARDMGVWLAWSLPYVLGSGAAAWSKPDFVGNRGTLRLIDNDEFFVQNTLLTLASVAFVRAYAQGIAYQGIWLLAFLRGQGIDFASSVVDGASMTSAEVGWSSVMGGLVASPAVISIPTAVAAAAVLETVWWMFVELSTRLDPTASLFDVESVTALILSPEVGTVLFGREGLEEMKESVADMRGGELPHLPQVGRAREFSETEYWLTVGRVALASAWMGIETVVTQNLWYAICTGSVGLLIGILARRRAVKMASEGT